LVAAPNLSSIAIFVTSHPAHPARLAIFLLLALAVRAGHAQTDPYSPANSPPAAPRDPNRYPIAVPQPTFRFQQPPGQQPVQQPPISIQPQQPVDPNRYPGPAQPAPAPSGYRQPPPIQPPPPQYSQPQPGIAQRPNFGPPPNQPAYPPQGAPAAPPAAPGELFQAGQIVAIVGDQFILYGDVAQTVNQMLQPAIDKAKSDAERREIERYREPLTKQVVGEMAQRKVLYLAFLRDVEESAGRDKMAEVKRNIDKKIREAFAQELEKYRAEVATANKEEIQKLLRREPTVVRLALMMKDHNLESLSELSALLSQYGSTLNEQMRQYGEHQLGMQMVRKNITVKPEVTHQEMLDYYQEHAADYAVPAKARFEILSVRFDSFPSKAAAYNAIGAMGNEVFFGAPFAAVARKSSQDPNADKGGYYDWTSKGSLASQAVDQAIFSLEPGKLSQILEDERGLYIVRVLERTDAGSVSFLDAQTEIKEDIIARKRDAEYKKFIASLSTGTKIWTIYDEDKDVARKPQDAVQQR
jgi:parvulin-like peptidyl-prolyl isomerase